MISQSITQVVLDRYRELLLSGNPPDPAEVQKTVSALDHNGRWPDIDYCDDTRSVWAPGLHLKRLRTLTLASAHPDSALNGDKAVRKAVWSALDHWLDKQYIHPSSWWYNRVGIPHQMRDVMLLLDRELSPGQFTAGWQVTAQSGRVDKTGANLIWLADLAVVRAAACGDTELLTRAAELASEEIAITHDEGIQPDYSFHQHDARLHTFGYGAAYAGHLTRLSWILRETPWAFSKEKLRILTDYILKGMDWMRRDAYTVPGTLDRNCSRPNGLGGKHLTPMLKLLEDVLPEQAGRMRAVIARESGRGKPLIGFKHFPCSDFTVYHRKDFSFFLKTMSVRTLPSESINDENLKGERLCCSDAMLMNDGLEYYNMMPVWDWSRLPGITAAAGLPDFKRCSFAGGAGTGRHGLTAIDYRFENALTARKSYFCCGNRVVCLIGSLRAPSRRRDVYTAMDQCRLDGPVTIGTPAGRRILKQDTTVEDVCWIHHRGTAYVLPNSERTEIRMGEVSGSWHIINRSRSGETVTDRVFLPLLHHGTNPSGIASGYTLAPADTPQAAQHIAENPGFYVPANRNDVQSVHFDRGPLMAAFYTAGSLKHGERSLIRVDHPCLLIVEGSDVWIAGPDHKASTVEVRIGTHSPLRISIPGNGTTVKTELRAGEEPVHF
mgnify:CR=1 FL=1